MPPQNHELKLMRGVEMETVPLSKEVSPECLWCDIYIGKDLLKGKF